MYIEIMDTFPKNNIFELLVFVTEQLSSYFSTPIKVGTFGDMSSYLLKLELILMYILDNHQNENMELPNIEQKFHVVRYFGHIARIIERIVQASLFPNKFFLDKLERIRWYQKILYYRLGAVLFTLKPKDDSVCRKDFNYYSKRFDGPEALISNDNIVIPKIPEGECTGCRTKMLKSSIFAMLQNCDHTLCMPCAEKNFIKFRRYHNENLPNR